jgi:hypothetical protein
MGKAFAKAVAKARLNALVDRDAEKRDDLRMRRQLARRTRIVSKKPTISSVKPAKVHVTVTAMVESEYPMTLHSALPSR